VLPDPGTSKFGTRWLIATVACSVIAALDGGYLIRLLSLSPIKVVHGQIWRLLTWPLVDLSALSLVFTCFAISKLGDDFANASGERRLQRFAIQIAIGTGVITFACAALRGGWYMTATGGWAMCDALVIAWARQFPTEQVDLYGLKLGGTRLVVFTLAVTLAFAYWRGFAGWIPELAACVLAMLYPRWLLAAR
jgi:membrane associated rhomboid family serine protease